MSDFTMTIGGEGVGAAETFDVVNPATGTPFAQAPACSPGRLDDAMAAAAAAFPAWRDDLAARRAALAAAAARLREHAGELAGILTAEQGKPLRSATIEVFGTAMWLQYFAELALPREVLQDDEKAFAELVRRPLGVVAAITPWNFPLALASWKLGPALLAGNTVVLKPSPHTPLATLRMGELLREVFPPGVLNVVSGPDPLGAAITAHPVPRKVSFTGSVATGRSVAAAAAPLLKRVTLELGGNDPAILLDDVDVPAVAGRVFDAAFQNNGQVCSAIKRVYVPETRYAEVVEALAQRAREAKVGEGTEEGVDLGPVGNLPQFERVRELVSAALDGGAKAAAGGRRLDRPGYFHEPTVLADVTDGSRIVDEEQFGPALPVIAYRDVGDAVARANATHFGLSGSVWGADTERAAAVAARLDCGTAWVNTHLVLAPHLPFGGVKQSGIGTENGPWGVHGCTDTQVLYTARS